MSNLFNFTIEESCFLNFANLHRTTAPPKSEKCRNRRKALLLGGGTWRREGTNKNKTVSKFSYKGGLYAVASIPSL